MRDVGGPSLHLYRNLADEFVYVDEQLVAPTSSANLAVAANELEGLDPSPQVNWVKAFLKAAQVQVNKIREMPSGSTASTSSRHRSGSRSRRSRSHRPDNDGGVV